MPRNGRKKHVGKCEGIEREARENALADLEETLHDEWCGHPEDDFPFGDDLDDPDGWDDLDEGWKPGRDKR